MAARLLAAAALLATTRATTAGDEGQPAPRPGIFDELQQELADVNAGVLALAPATVTTLACSVFTLALLMWVYLRARAAGTEAEDDAPADLRHSDEFMQGWLEERGREREQREAEVSTQMRVACDFLGDLTDWLSDFDGLLIMTGRTGDGG